MRRRDQRITSSRIAESVLNSDSKTLRCAAVPAAPLFGGKLNNTIAIRSATGVWRSHQSRDAISQPVDALRLGLHIKFFARRWSDRPPNTMNLSRHPFGDRHHHGPRRASTHGGRLPILQALKLETLNAVAHQRFRRPHRYRCRRPTDSEKPVSEITASTIAAHPP